MHTLRVSSIKRDRVVLSLIVCVLFFLTTTNNYYNVDCCCPSLEQSYGASRGKFRIVDEVRRIFSLKTRIFRFVYFALVLFLFTYSDFASSENITMMSMLEHHSLCSFPVMFSLSSVEKPIRLAVTELGSDEWSVEFPAHTRITVTKKNVLLRKALMLVLGNVETLPMPGCNGHGLSQREIATCTKYSVGTVNEYFAELKRREQDPENSIKQKNSKATTSSLPEFVQKRLLELIIEDPSLSKKTLEHTINEEFPDLEKPITSTDVHGFFKSIDFNQIQTGIRKQLGSEKKRHDFLFRKLLCMLEVLLANCSNVPQSVIVEIQNLKSIITKHAKTSNITRILDEERQSNTNNNRRHWKQLRIMNYIYGGNIEVSCPSCNSTHVRKKCSTYASATTDNGDERSVNSMVYYCLNDECGQKTFTVPHPLRELGAYLDKLAIYKVLKQLVVQRVSLRNASKGFFSYSKDLNHSTLLRNVQRVTEEMPRWYEIFTARTTDVIAVDEKWVKMKGKWYYVYLAVDPKSLDLLHIDVFESNGTDSAIVFLTQLKNFGFSPSLIITDQLPAYNKAIETVFPDCVHLECLLHVHRSALRSIKKAARELGLDKSKALKKEIEEKLDDNPELDAKKILSKALNELRSKLYKVFESKTVEELDKNWSLFLQCEETPELAEIVHHLESCYEYVKSHLLNPQSPKTSNAVEGVIRGFSRKYSAMESFQSFYSMQCWCAVFQVYWRLTPFERGKRAGLSPAKLMGYPVKDLTWQDFILGMVDLDQSAA